MINDYLLSILGLGVILSMSIHVSLQALIGVEFGWANAAVETLF